MSGMFKVVTALVFAVSLGSGVLSSTAPASAVADRNLCMWTDRDFKGEVTCWYSQNIPDIPAVSGAKFQDSISSISNTSQEVACFFEHNRYQGKKTVVAAGQSVSRLFGDENDSFSSLKYGKYCNQ